MPRKKKEEIITEVAQEKFGKEQLLKSVIFEDNKDILNVILEDDSEYTLEEVKERIKEFKKEEVK